MLLIGLLGPASSGCAGKGGGARAPARPAAAGAGERLREEFLEPNPDLVVVIRPQAVRGDPIYGPLVRRALSLARARNPLAAPSGAYEAMDEADEVDLVARDLAQERLAELAIVIHGVRASVDPARLVDEHGAALWVPGPSGTQPDVHEFVRPPGADGQTPDASLFELPERTWVFATGPARARARSAFAGAWRAAPVEVCGNLPVALQISGRALAAHIQALRPPGLLAPLARKLRSVTVTPSLDDSSTVQAVFTYDDAGAVAPAGATAKEALAALSTANSTDYGWLAASSVETSACCVVVTTPLPAGLVNGLLH